MSEEHGKKHHDAWYKRRSDNIKQIQWAVIGVVIVAMFMSLSAFAACGNCPGNKDAKVGAATCAKDDKAACAAKDAKECCPVKDGKACCEAKDGKKCCDGKDAKCCPSEKKDKASKKAK